MVALLRRFPRIRPPVSRPVLDPSAKIEFPEFDEDYAVLEEVLDPPFTEYDTAALRDQHRYRRQNVIVLLGAALLTGLGGLQAVFPGQRWPTVVLAFLGLILVLSSAFAKESESLQGYLQARVRAERVRSLYFLYLSRTGRYAEDNRRTALRQAVRAIERGKEIE